jgi:hypothetical protein
MIFAMRLELARACALEGFLARELDVHDINDVATDMHQRFPVRREWMEQCRSLRK